jgi:N-acetylneuraminic acid mutarotase
LPAPRDHAGVGLVNGKLYVLGGRAFNAIGSNGNKATSFSYDLSSKKWNDSLPPPPSAPRAGIASGVVGTLIYCIGGEGNPNSATGVFAENQAYDTASNSWKSYTPMPVPRHGTSAVVINTRIYVPGGGVTGGGNPTFHNDYYQAA